MEPYAYEVDLTWQHRRLGQLSSPVLTNTIEVATPPEFPNGIPGIWSPEHLLVAAVSSCLMTTFLAVAENSRLLFESFDCRAVGKLKKVDNKLMISEVQLFPSLLLPPGGDLDKAQRVLVKSEQACLIANSVRSRVTMQPTISVAALAEATT